MGDVIINGNTGEFEKPQSGVVQAVCSGVWDIGLQRGSWQGQEIMQYKIVMRFELNETIKEGKYAGKRFCLNSYYTKSLGKKANLRHALESWRGKPFTQEELGQFNLSKLKGANCLVNIGYREKSGKPYIMSIMPITKDMIKIEPELNTEETPEWIEKLIIEGKANEDALRVADGVNPTNSDDDVTIPF